MNQRRIIDKQRGQSITVDYPGRLIEMHRKEMNANNAVRIEKKLSVRLSNAVCLYWGHTGSFDPTAKLIVKGH